MLPQSELDNYKLQVELLQEKLQRSEISRQQLEHKLDKILQKRDEHDKIVRSKARQKYQQFLEEQQRRNERNKQLVQMLERIEQQTEVMNARSERLKMMKLQYEMYFAKLVHTQTRRCIQNSVQPMPYFMPISSNQPVCSAAMKGYNNYGSNVETTTPLGTNNSYQCFATPQEENLAKQTSDIPTLTQFVRKEENICIDPKDTNMASSKTPQQLYQYNTEPVKHVTDIPANFSFKNNLEIPHNDPSYTKTKASTTHSSAACLLPNDKKLPESREHSNLSIITTSSTFEEIPNLAMMPQKDELTLNELPQTTSIVNSNNHISNFNTEVKSLNRRQDVNDILLKSINETEKLLDCAQNSNNVNKFNKKSQDARNEIQEPKTMEFRNNDIIMPNQYQNHPTSSQLENSSPAPESCLSFSKNKNYLKKQSASIERTENAAFTNNMETNSSTTPVSIENIENEIYGELLSPLETAEVTSQQTSNVVPKLFENLVTQSENTSSEESPVLQEATAVKQHGEYSTVAADNNNEENAILYNYEQNTTNEEFNNIEQSEKPVKNFADYTSYENVDSAEIDGNQQQYDYTNYDPTQYSYPGYVYDETTGEYKPDPNAPLEQYATEGYEQQYQQQDYDYNQTYTEEATDLPTNNVENTIDNNFDTTQKESSSSVTTADSNLIQQQAITQPDSSQTAVTAEVTTTATPTSKIMKPTSILSSAEKSEAQKKKKRVNFIDSSETDESAAAAADKGAASTSKPLNANSAASSESDFDFSSSAEAEAKVT